jgi:hypothetical protein
MKRDILFSCSKQADESALTDWILLDATLERQCFLLTTTTGYNRQPRTTSAHGVLMSKSDVDENLSENSGFLFKDWKGRSFDLKKQSF